MKNIRNLALLPILGKPLVIYLGIITFTSFLVTAVLGVLILKGKRISLKTHLLIAKISLTLAVIHGFLAFSIFF
jgi:hypothetical protein